MAVPAPSSNATAGRDQPDRHGLGPHAAGDEPFAAHPVRQGAGDKLPSSPDGRVQRGQDADAADRQAVLAKNSGKMPQARPSLRLLTRPAWLQADRARSRKLVSRKTCLVDRPWWAAAEVFTWVAASCSAKAAAASVDPIPNPRRLGPVKFIIILPLVKPVLPPFTPSSTSPAITPA